MATGRGWIGVDFDGTLAHYDEWRGDAHAGEPVQQMVSRVKEWLAAGQEVRIVTARVAPAKGPESILMARLLLTDWCAEHIGQVLKIQCDKDMGMIELWDDRAVQVIPNTGEPMPGRTAMAPVSELGVLSFHCVACKAYIYGLRYEYLKFCPNCGRVVAGCGEVAS